MTLAERRVRWAWIFLAPAVAILLLVAGFPLVQTIWYSFTEATLDNITDYRWLGFENYIEILTDRSWWRAVWNTVFFTVFSVSTELVLGTAIALCLHQPLRIRGFLRAAILVPWAIPTVVSSKIWEWLYQDQFGFFNYFLMTLGIISEPIAFMGNPSLALPAIIAVDVWKTTPFVALLVLAGLSGIPREMYEAAKIDGARPIQSFFYITLPMLKPTLLVALIFRTLDAMRVFDIIYIIQGSNERTASVSIYARQRMIDFQEIGLGSAASVLIFAIVGAFTVFYVSTLKVKFND